MSIKRINFQILLTITILLLLFLIGCNQKPDTSQFITYESYHKAMDDCGGSLSADVKCIWSKFEPKVDKHCSENKLSASQCERLKGDVIRAIGNFAEEDTKKLNKVREDLKRAK